MIGIGSGSSRASRGECSQLFGVRVLLPGWRQVKQRDRKLPGVTCCRTRTIVCFQVQQVKLPPGIGGELDRDSLRPALNTHNCSGWVGQAGQAAVLYLVIPAAVQTDSAQLFALNTQQVQGSRIRSVKKNKKSLYTG